MNKQGILFPWRLCHGSHLLGDCKRSVLNSDIGGADRLGDSVLNSDIGGADLLGDSILDSDISGADLLGDCIRCVLDSDIGDSIDVTLLNFCRLLISMVAD